MAGNNFQKQASPIPTSQVHHPPPFPRSGPYIPPFPFPPHGPAAASSPSFTSNARREEQYLSALTKHNPPPRRRCLPRPGGWSWGHKPATMVYRQGSIIDISTKPNEVDQQLPSTPGLARRAHTGHGRSLLYSEHFQKQASAAQSIKAIM